MQTLHFHIRGSAEPSAGILSFEQECVVTFSVPEDPAFVEEFTKFLQDYYDGAEVLSIDDWHERCERERRQEPTTTHDFTPQETMEPSTWMIGFCDESGEFFGMFGPVDTLEECLSTTLDLSATDHAPDDRHFIMEGIADHSMMARYVWDNGWKQCKA